MAIARYFALIGLCAFVSFPKPVSAQVDHVKRTEMVRLCEAVIAEQSKAPFENFAPAPDFASGLLRDKEYAAYNSSRDLVAIARSVSGDWVSCYVREAEEASSRWSGYEASWSSNFEEMFPKTDYSWALRRHPRQKRVFYLGAVKCLDNLALWIDFTDEQDLYFRVRVIKRLPTHEWASLNTNVVPLNAQVGLRQQERKSCDAVSE